MNVELSRNRVLTMRCSWDLVLVYWYSQIFGDASTSGELGTEPDHARGIIAIEQMNMFKQNSIPDAKTE